MCQYKAEVKHEKLALDSIHPRTDSWVRYPLVSDKVTHNHDGSRIRYDSSRSHC